MPDFHSACRHMSFRVLLLCGAFAGSAVGAERAAPVVTLAAHDNAAQVVFTFSGHVGFGLQRIGDTLLLRFPGAGTIPAANGDPRTVTAIQGGASRATIGLAPSSSVRTRRKGDRIIIDVMSPPPPAPTPAPARAPKVVAEAPVPPVVAAALPPPPAPPPPESSPLAQAAPPSPPGAPVTIASAADLPAGASGTAIFLPFKSGVGAAAFRRGGAAWVVFDERHQIDLTALEDAPFVGTTVQTLSAATLLRLPLDEGSELRLTRTDTGWIVAALRSAPPPPPISVVAKPSRFDLPAVDANQVVAVPDPDTGQNLLVGTLRGTPAGVPVARRVPAFVLEPTWQGVVVEPIADTITLRATADGFVIGAGDEPLSPAPDAARTLADAAFLTRRFEIPTGPPDMLLRRLQAQVNDAGEAPAQSRARPRKAAATTLIALGMGVEAQAMLRLATEEDPRLINDADVTGLTAIAAILGGRAAETEGITDPALNGTDEVAFWRAIRTAQAHEGAPEAASVLAATVNLLLAYPQPLRSALLPLAIETMALGGAPDAADALLHQMKDASSLDLARAIRLEATGQTADALAKYDGIAAGRDRLQAARAAAYATTLRLKMNAITPTQAAAALEQQFFNWRGDGRELDLRLRVASLRAQTGAWRPAFALLRETGALYPDSAPMIQARMAELMTTLIKGPASTAISPLELVALTEENAELVATVGSAQVAALMADKLLALDLPHRADPVIERMMRAAPVGVAQAALGVRLASLRVREGDDAGAQAALANSNAPALPGALIERRGLIAARLAARTGHLNRARTILSDIGTQAADELRASLLTDAQDWPGAASALTDLVAKSIPPDGPLTPEQQDTLLRLASALSRAGNVAGLRALGSREGARIEGPRTGMFRLLTAAPVSNVADLPRSSAEMSLAKAIPVGLTAIGSR